MTSNISDARTHVDDAAAPSRTPLLAALGIGASAVLTAVGTFVGPNDTGDATRDDPSTWLMTVGIALAAAIVVFGLVVRTASRGDAGRRALVLGVVTLLSVAVFWAGVTTVLAAAALACALVERDRRGSFGTPSTVGLVLAGVATIAATLLAFVG